MELDDKQPADLQLAGLEQTGASAWLAHFQPEWRTRSGGIHGGLTVAVMLQAAAQAGGRRPATIGAHIHLPVAPGQAELNADVVRTGRSAASVSVSLRQAKVCASALVLLDGAATPSPVEGSKLIGEPMPATAPEDAAPLQPPPGMSPPLLERVEIRPTGDSRPLAGGPEAVLRAWIRPRRPIADPFARATVLLDALAPSLLAIRRESIPIPTIELSIHFAPDAPITPWSAITQRTVWWSSEFCVDEAELRNEDGSLIAQARQRRRILGAP